MSSPSSKTVILSAPPAWGKTRNALQLQREFGCAQVVDDWEPRGGRFTPGALHLTNVSPSELQACFNVPPSVRVVGRGW